MHVADIRHCNYVILFQSDKNSGSYSNLCFPYTVVLWLKTQIIIKTANLLTANCKISRRNCVKNKSQRGILTDAKYRREIPAEHGEKEYLSLRIKIN